MRTDSAGATHGLVQGCRVRSIGVSVVARSNKQVTAAISSTFTERDAWWVPARRRDGGLRDSASVAELTDLVDTVGLAPRHPADRAPR